jgi:hypothetical protein
MTEWKQLPYTQHPVHRAAVVVNGITILLAIIDQYQQDGPFHASVRNAELAIIYSEAFPTLEGAKRWCEAVVRGALAELQD